VGSTWGDTVSAVEYVLEACRCSLLCLQYNKPDT
jgi:hypothetical protein